MKRSSCGLPSLCAVLSVLLVGCASSDESVNSSEVRAAVVAGLVAAQDPPPREQVRTFTADLRAGWAAAYDPADPPGCVAGGLREAGPAPCTVYVLQRRKTRWVLAASGKPGTVFVPEDAPADLGAVDKLGWLAD